MADIIQDYTKNVPPICLYALCTYTTQRKHACQTKRGVHMPQYIWMPPFVWMGPCMFGCPHMPPYMFGQLLYV